jgi:hypothetical protein
MSMTYEQRRRDAEEFWRQNDRQVARERAARQRPVVKAIRPRRTPVASAAARHTLERLERQIRHDATDELEIACLKRAGVPEGDWRVQLIRRRIEQRRNGGDV